MGNFYVAGCDSNQPCQDLFAMNGIWWVSRGSPSFPIDESGSGDQKYGLVLG